MNKNVPLLIDFDGVIKLGNKIAPDAKEFFDFIEEEKIPICIFSNSTLKTAELIQEFLNQNSLLIPIPTLTAFDVTVQYVKNHYKKVKVYCRDYLIHHFDGLISDSNPDAVVIGDIGDNWNFDTMNEIFTYVINGADIVAMHKNKFWKPKDKLILDAGAFISAIEIATDKQSILIGKPSPIYFKTAIKYLGFAPDSDFYMIGDDLENDIIASQIIGGRGILILTGKTKVEDFKDVRPNYIVNNLLEVIDTFRRG